MKFSNVSKVFWGGVIAISTAALAPLPVSAQTTAPTQPGTAETTIPNTTTTDVSDDDGSDWGWLGLLGLLGLAGLAGRKSADRRYERTDTTLDPTISTTRSDYNR